MRSKNEKATSFPGLYACTAISYPESSGCLASGWSQLTLGYWLLEFYYRRISAVKQCKPLRSSQSNSINFFEFSRVSPGAHTSCRLTNFTLHTSVEIKPIFPPAPPHPHSPFPRSELFFFATILSRFASLAACAPNIDQSYSVYGPQLAKANRLRRVEKDIKKYNKRKIRYLNKPEESGIVLLKT